MRWLVIILLILVALFLAARYVPVAPEEQRPGTRLSGSWVSEPVADFSTFWSSGQRAYVQTAPWWGIPHSVTTTSFVVEGKLYVPCRSCAQKRWPRNVAADPHVVIKLGDDLYPLKAVRVEDPAELKRIFQGNAREGLWAFRMDPR
ncbi:MAG: hypothetical protein AAF529_12280 [Pseudomonadota bacterium]